MKLYKISEDLAKLMHKVNNAEEELTDEEMEEVQKQFIALQDSMGNKIDSMIHVMREYEGYIEHIKGEKARLTDLQKSYTSKVNSMVKFITFIMDWQKLPSLDTKENRLSFRKTKNGSVKDPTNVNIPDNLVKKSLSVEDKAIIEDILITIPGMKDCISESMVSDKEVKNFINSLEDGQRVEINDEYYIRKGNKFFYLDSDDSQVELCEIVEKRSLSIK